MTLNDEELKRVFRSYIDGRVPGTRQSCPSFNELSKFFEPRTRRRQKLKIIDHITSCSACAEEFDFLRAIHKHQNQFVNSSVGIWPTSRECVSSSSLQLRTLTIWRYVSVAIGILFVIVSLAVITRVDFPHDTRTTNSSMELLRPYPGQSVTFPLVFEWEPVAGADSYRLEVFDDTLMLVWESSEIAGTFFQPPEQLRRKLVGDGVYYWMITARRNGARLAESGLSNFNITRKNP